MARLILLATVSGLVATQPVPAPAASEEGLVWEGVVSEDAWNPLFIDHHRRRLYVERLGTLGELDLDAPYGEMFLRVKAIPMTEGGPTTRATVAPDLGGRRAFIADRSGDAFTGHSVTSIIRVLDLESLEITAEWNLATHVGIPNFLIFGLAYSEQDERLYMSGSIIGSNLVGAADFTGFPFYPLSIVALDANTGKLAWFRALSTKCLRPMTAAPGLAHIFRSRRSDALYLACMRSEATASAAMFPGAAGVLRVRIAPGAGPADALQFHEEFFRVSGSFAALIGTMERSEFDYATDRFVFVSSSVSSPGAWVFDGDMDAWVGFVPTAGIINASLGLDPVTGHLMLLDGNISAVAVTDMRVSPVPQGDLFELSSPRGDFTPNNARDWIVDPLTRRVFILAQPRIGQTPGGFSRLLAFRDATPIASPPLRVAYDELTDGIAEGPETTTTFATAAKGFGVRAFLVGGTGGLTSPGRPGYAGLIYSRVVGDGIPPADRGFWAARVSSLDLRNVGASAAARAVVPDQGTNDQRGGIQSAVADPDVPGSPDVPAPVISALDWPWPEAFCLDPGGEPASKEAPGGASSARVECDLTRERAMAEVRAGALGGTFSDYDISIGSASFRTSSERRAGTGVSAESVATVHGLEIKIPGTGTLRIGDIRREVTTEAGGRPKTSSVGATHSIEGVEIIDESGDRYTCGENCPLDEVAGQVNDVFSPVMRMRIPKAEVIATKGGAFAAFREKTRHYINDLVMNNDASRAVPAIHLEIYNDWGEKSRLVLQLAAIESSAIYAITSSALGDTSLPSPDGSQLAPMPPLEPLVSGLPGPAIGPANPPEPAGGLVPRIVRSALFLTRSPGDLVSMLLLWVLLGLGVTVGLRRASLTKAIS